jgi:hypothetical protein
MRKRGKGIWAVVLLGLTTAAAGAGEPGAASPAAPPHFGGDKPDTSWWTSLFGTPEKSAGEVKEVDPGLADVAPEMPSVAERAARTQQREMRAFLRRMQVCDRLRQIAFDTNDAELERRANDLEEKAKQLYDRRTARLPLGTADEAVLEQRLGTGTAMPRPRADGPARDGRAALRGEDK